jgi:hypothetical protein
VKTGTDAESSTSTALVETAADSGECESAVDAKTETEDGERHLGSARKQ